MKVTVQKKPQVVQIHTEYIKLENAMKLAFAVPTGGSAKMEIQEGRVSVNGEICLERGKKLRPGDRFSFDGKAYLIGAHENL